MAQLQTLVLTSLCWCDNCLLQYQLNLKKVKPFSDNTQLVLTTWSKVCTLCIQGFSLKLRRKEINTQLNTRCQGKNTIKTNKQLTRSCWIVYLIYTMAIIKTLYTVPDILQLWFDIREGLLGDIDWFSSATIAFNYMKIADTDSCHLPTVIKH